MNVSFHEGWGGMPQMGGRGSTKQGEQSVVRTQESSLRLDTWFEARKNGGKKTNLRLHVTPERPFLCSWDLVSVAAGASSPLEITALGTQKIPVRIATRHCDSGQREPSVTLSDWALLADTKLHPSFVILYFVRGRAAIPRQRSLCRWQGYGARWKGASISKEWNDAWDCFGASVHWHV